LADDEGGVSFGVTGDFGVRANSPGRFGVEMTRGEGATIFVGGVLGGAALAMGVFGGFGIDTGLDCLTVATGDSSGFSALTGSTGCSGLSLLLDPLDVS